MIVTKKYSKGYWWLKLSVILVFVSMYCGLMTQSVYAEVVGQEIVQQQNVVSNNPDNIVYQDNVVNLDNINKIDITDGSDNLDNKEINKSLDNVNSNISIKQQKKVRPTLTLTLQDEDGKPISGVTVSAMEGDFVGKEKKSAQTNENGKVVFKHLKSGTYYFYANINAIQKHAGYGLPGAIRSFKTARSYYISESKQYDLSENVECTFTIKKGAYIWIETFLDVSLPQKIVIVNKKLGIEQMIPVAATDFIQIYMPMRNRYQIITIKDNDFDSWIIEFYAHDRLHIELL